MAETLMRVAEDFERESVHWSEYPRMRVRLIDASSLLVDAARAVLRTGDAHYGEQWRYAGVVTLSHVQLVRTFRDGRTVSRSGP